MSVDTFQRYKYDSCLHFGLPEVQDSPVPGLSLDLVDRAIMNGPERKTFLAYGGNGSR